MFVNLHKIWREKYKHKWWILSLFDRYLLLLQSTNVSEVTFEWFWKNTLHFPVREVEFQGEISVPVVVLISPKQRIRWHSAKIWRNSKDRKHNHVFKIKYCNFWLLVFQTQIWVHKIKNIFFQLTLKTLDLWYFYILCQLFGDAHVQCRGRCWAHDIITKRKDRIVNY